MKNLSFALTLAGILFLNFSTLFSQTFVETAKVVASDREMNGRFGFSTAIYEDIAVVGTFPNTSQSGKVYIFEKQSNGSWVEIQKITGHYSLGSSVAIYQDTIVIGAESDDTGGRGAAYVYEKDINGVFVLKQKLSISDFLDGRMYGDSVDIFGDVIVVGDPLADTVNGLSSGTAYVFEKNSNDQWIETNKLISSDGHSQEVFGGTVATNGEYISIGATHWPALYGKAYMFKKENGIWVETEEILPSRYTYNFGDSISMWGDYMAFGGSELELSIGPTKYYNAGVVYIFKLNNSGEWIETDRINASEFDEDDYFGESVGLYEDRLIVGAYYEDEDETESNTLENAGSAYVFERNPDESWSQIQKIVASDREAFDNFGISVAIYGESFMVGAMREGHDENGDNYIVRSGSIYAHQSQISLSSNSFTEDDQIIFPNPVDKKLEIIFNKSHNSIKLQVYNLLGQELHTKHYSNAKKIEYQFPFDIGIYYLIITNEFGKKTVSKIIKK
ncbi:MAG: T9SS type A sorting domain-containing protein [Flavobacteriaceae bacterium]